MPMLARRIAAVMLAFSAVVALGLGPAVAGPNACEQSAKGAFQSCKLAARADARETSARCANLAAAPAVRACVRQASADGEEALADCKDQNELRRAVCKRLGVAPYSPLIDPMNFVAAIDNPYLPLVPGTTFISEGQTDEGFEHVEFAVTHATRVILGVTCVEVHDVSTIDGKVMEDTRDWFAQDTDGNVWYFGENTTIVDGGATLVDGGLPVDLSGSWTAGVDGALPGIVMKGHPAIGDFYRQEFLLGEAEDLAEVQSLGESVTVPVGAFAGCLKTEESSPLSPGDVETKVYAAGVGLVLTIEPNGARSELVKITTE